MPVCSSGFVVDNVSTGEKGFSDWVNRGIGIYMHCITTSIFKSYTTSHTSNKSQRMKA
jgi:hypothetical protein